MKPEHIDVLLENQTLKNEFVAHGLDLSHVFCEDPDDLARENRVLANLLDWVQKHRESGGDRKRMEGDGYHFPPIDPGISPDNDWLRFENWLQDKPVRSRLRDLLPPGFKPAPSEELADEALLPLLEELAERLHEIHFSVDLMTNVPSRLVYEYLLEMLDDEWDIIEEGYWHLDGCTGYCPGCFQRPWCEFGTSSCWPEDEEVGRIYFIEALHKFVSPSPTSLAVLRKLQAEHDQDFNDFREAQSERNFPPEPDLFDADDDDELPF